MRREHNMAVEREPLRSRKEVAEYLGVPAETLTGWAYRGIGPPVYRVVRYAKYRLSEFDRWLDERVDPMSKAL